MATVQNLRDYMIWQVKTLINSFPTQIAATPYTLPPSW